MVTNSNGACDDIENRAFSGHTHQIYAKKTDAPSLTMSDFILIIKLVPDLCIEL